MRLVGVISATVFSLTLGLAASAYAQAQHDQKEEEKATQQQNKDAKPEQTNERRQPILQVVCLWKLVPGKEAARFL